MFKSEKVANLARITGGMIDATGLTAEELEELQTWMLSTPRRSAQIRPIKEQLENLLGKADMVVPVYKGTTHEWLGRTTVEVEAARASYRYIDTAKIGRDKWNIRYTE